MNSLAVTSSGCSSLEAVRNVQGAPVYRNWGELTPEQVRHTIVAGLIDEKWNVIDEDQGWLIAMREDGSEWAKVRITYTTSTYDIVHFESAGFDFDGSRIDEDYNEWIEDLVESIDDEFRKKPSDVASTAPAGSTVEATGTPAPDAAQPTVPAESGPASAPPVPGDPEPDPSWNESPPTQ